MKTSYQRFIQPWLLREVQSIVAALLLLTVFLFQIYVSQMHVKGILEHAVNDDTFYYLEVAYRAANGEGFTFDGINSTNGFQPAWGFLLTLVAMFANSKIAFLRTAIIIASLFNLVAGIFIYRISRLVFIKWVAIIPLFIWSSIQLAPGFPLTALETSMNWATLGLVVWFLVKMALSRKHHSSIKKCYQDVITVGFLCALLFLIRVDNVVFIAMVIFLASSLLTYSTVRLRLKFGMLFISCSIGIIALILVAPYLLWNLFHHSGLLPISGLIKQKDNYIYVTQHMGGYFSPDTFSYSTSRVADEVLWVIANSLRILGGGEPFWLTSHTGFLSITLGILLSLIVIHAFQVRLSVVLFTSWRTFFETSFGVWILVLTCFWLFYGLLDMVFAAPTKQVLKVLLFPSMIMAGSLIMLKLGSEKRVESSLSDAQKVIMWLLLPMIVHLGILVYTVDYFLNYTKWYFANYFVIMALSAGVLSEFIGTSILSLFRQERRMVYSVMAMWFTAGFLMSLYLGVSKTMDPLREPPYDINGQYEIASWVDANLPEDSVLASYNAGVIGYFSNRSTINLDGLINNRELVPYLFGPKTMTDYIDLKCPDYLVDYINLDIDPPTLFQNVEEGQRVLRIEASRLRPIYWMKSVDFHERTRTFIVLEIDKSYCVSS